MKVTDSKDLVKVSQIRPIMQEYFGISMDLARIKLMAYMLHALCGVQTVSLHKLASAMPASVERDSNLRCIQRFIANYALNLNLAARMIFSLLPVKDGWVLSMDRANWKFGEFNINILTLGVTTRTLPFHCCSACWQARRFQLGGTQGYNGAIHPTFWTWLHRLSCGRPRVYRKEWIGWLNDNRIRYYIRIRQDIWIVKPSTGERIRAWWLFNSLKVGQEKFYYKTVLHKGQYVYPAGSRIKRVPELQF